MPLPQPPVTLDKDTQHGADFPGDDYRQRSWREMMGLLLSKYIPFRLLGSMHSIASLWTSKSHSFNWWEGTPSARILALVF